MVPKEIACSKDKNHKIVEITKMSGVHDFVPGKDFDPVRAPLYFCEDCKKGINF